MQFWVENNATTPSYIGKGFCSGTWKECLYHCMEHGQAGFNMGNNAAFDTCLTPHVRETLRDLCVSR